MEILSEQPVKIPVGGTAEVQVRMSWSRNGSNPGRLERSAGGNRRGPRVVDGAGAGPRAARRRRKAKPGLKGNLMANAFLQTTVTEKDGKTREVRNLIGPLPAMPFEIVKP